MSDAARNSPHPAGRMLAEGADAREMGAMAGGGHDAPGAFGLKLLGAGAALFAAAGGLLWWREGEKLFTDGLIAAIARCF